MRAVKMGRPQLYLPVEPLAPKREPVYPPHVQAEIRDALAEHLQEWDRREWVQVRAIFERGEAS